MCVCARLSFHRYQSVQLKCHFKGWRLAQLLRAPTGWAEDLILFPITQARQLTIACHSSPKGIWCPLLASVGTAFTRTHPHTGTQKKNLKEKSVWKGIFFIYLDPPNWDDFESIIANWIPSCVTFILTNLHVSFFPLLLQSLALWSRLGLYLPPSSSWVLGL